MADGQSQLTNLANNGGDTGKIVDGGQGTGAPGAGPVIAGGTGAGTTVPTTTPAPPVTTDPPTPASHVISANAGVDSISKFLHKPSTILLSSGLLGGIVGAFALGGPAGLLIGAVIGLLAGYAAVTYFGAGGKKK